MSRTIDDNGQKLQSPGVVDAIVDAVLDVEAPGTVVVVVDDDPAFTVVMDGVVVGTDVLPAAVVGRVEGGMVVNLGGITVSVQNRSVTVLMSKEEHG